MAAASFTALATGVPIMSVVAIEAAHLGTQLVLSREGFRIVRQEFGLFMDAIGGWPTIAVAGVVAGVAAIAAAGESSAEQLAKLRVQLSATRDDSAAMADTVTAAAKQVSASSPFGTAEARTAAQTIASQPLFQGNAQQLADLVREAGDLATVLNEALTPAAKTVAEALADPAKVAQELANQGLRGFSQGLVETVQHMQEAGDKVGAATLALNTLRAATQDATQNAMTPLQQSLHDLSAAFTKAGQDGRSLSDNVGSGISNVLTGSVNLLRDLVGQLNGLRQWIDSLSSARAQQTQQQIQQQGGVQVPWWFPLPAGPGGRAAAPSWLAGGGFQAPIADAANAAGFSQQQLAFTMRLVQQESGFNQLDPMMGGTLTSSAGALGLFQLMPQTAAGLGVDPNSAQGNIQGGIQYIAQLWAKYGGNAGLVAMAYNWGPGNVDAFLAGVKTLRDVPSETSSFVSSVAGVNVASLVGAQVATSAAAAVPLSANSIGAGASAADTINSADKVANAAKTTGDAIDGLNRKQQQLLAGLAAAFNAGDSDRVAQYNSKLADLQGELNRTLTPQQQYIKQLQDQVTLSTPVTEGDRKIAEALEQIRQHDLDHPESAFTDADKGKVLALVLADQSNQFAKIAANVDLSTQSQKDLGDAWLKGADAAQLAQAHAQAFQQVIALFPSGSTQFAAALAVLTQKFVENAQAAARAKVAQDTFKSGLQAQYVQAEIDTLGLDNQQRTLLLAHLQAEISLREQAIDPTSKLGQAYLASVDNLSALTAAYQAHEAALSNLANLFSQSFDTIGNAMAQAFVQGQGAAVNWGNVMKSVVEQVIQQFLKLAVINPLVNSLFGQSNPTLTTTLAALALGGGGGSSSAAGLALIGGGLGLAGGGPLNAVSFGGGSAVVDTGIEHANLQTVGIPQAVVLPSGQASGGSSLLGSVGNLFSLGSIADKLGLTNFGGQFSSLGSSLGLTGEGGLFSGIGSGISNFLGTPLFGAGALTSATDSALAGLGPGVFGPAALSDVGLSGLTIGGALGGLGLGFGAGTLLNSLVGGNKLGGTVGSGVGALAGAAIGTIIPGVGTLIGGLIGGGGGGLLGGLFGNNHPLNSWGSTYVGLGSNGMLSLGESLAQAYGSTAQDRTNAQAAIDQINAFMQSSGVSIGGIANVNGAGRQLAVHPGDLGAIHIGQQGGNDPSLFNSIGAAFGDFQFTSANPNISGVIGTRSFANLQDLANVVTAVNSFVTALSSTNAANQIGTFLSQLGAVANADVPGRLTNITTYVTQTLPNLLQPLEGSLKQQIAQINQSYGPAITAGQSFGGYGVDQLQAAQAAAIAKVNAANDSQLSQSDATIAARYQTAAAALAGTLPGQMQAALATFDANAQQQRQQLSDTLTGIYGDSYKQTADYATRMAALENTLGQERLAVAQQYNQQIAANDNAAAKVASDLSVRQAAAKASISGSPQDAQASALLSFDANAAQQRIQFSQQLVQIYGTAYTSTADYAQQMTDLETTLGQERLAIAQQYAQKIQQADMQASVTFGNNQVQLAVLQSQQSGNPAWQKATALYAFDFSAWQQQVQLSTQLTQAFGAGYAGTPDYAAQVKALTDLQAAQRAALSKQYDQQIAQAHQTAAALDVTYANRYASAAAQVSGDPAAQKGAALAVFDQQASQEQQQLHDQMVSLFGDAYTTTAAYARKLAELEKAQGEERLALAKQYDDKILQTANQAIASLNSYALTLQTSADSPLSPQAQYQIALRAFTSTSSAAAGGDFNAITQLQTVSQTFLAAAKTLFGSSGTNYVGAFNQVLDALATVGSQTPDTLTASIYKQQSQTQTDQLIAALGNLQSEVHQLRLGVQQGTPTTPVNTSISGGGLVPFSVGSSFVTNTLAPPPSSVVFHGDTLSNVVPFPVRPAAAVPAAVPQFAGAPPVSDGAYQRAVLALLGELVATLRAEARGSTQQLDQSLAGIGKRVAALNDTLRQAASKPTRASAT